MNSLRSKITLLIVSAILIAMMVATSVSVSMIRSLGNSDADQMLKLLCESGQKNLNTYFEGVENSVGLVSTYAELDLEGLEPEQLKKHVEHVRTEFANVAAHTNGILTYYYRIDPAVSETEKGFWYVDINGTGFKEYEVTDISKYDTEDTGNLVWFTVPKKLGKDVWLPPYITDNLGARVFSYNVPIFCKDTFVGVVGIEIDYSAVAALVDSIRLYNGGYAFLNDEEGNLICHPDIDAATLTEETKPVVPEGLLDKEDYVNYTYNGTEKRGICRTLSNGMRLNVSVPVSEINGNWKGLITRIIIVAVFILLVFILVTLRFTNHFTKSLRELTRSVEKANEGVYDLHMNYNGKDEIGVLAKAYNKLTGDLKNQIRDLNSLAYADELTSVRNRGAFNVYIRQMDEKLSGNGDVPEYAIVIFDCVGLEKINKRFGKEKGDENIKAACQIICKVYAHSPVFRVGDDDFAVILQGEDYKKRQELYEQLKRRCAETAGPSGQEWKHVRLSMGIAVYDPEVDAFVSDVVLRAEKQIEKDKKSKGSMFSVDLS